MARCFFCNLKVKSEAIYCLELPTYVIKVQILKKQKNDNYPVQDSGPSWGGGEEDAEQESTDNASVLRLAVGGGSRCPFY